MSKKVGVILMISLVALVMGCTKLFKPDDTGNVEMLNSGNVVNSGIVEEVLTGIETVITGELDNSLDTEQVVCTMEYAPVCAKINCNGENCEPIEQTFGNKCMMDANKLAEFLYDGECLIGLKDGEIEDGNMIDYCLDDELHMQEFQGENANRGFNYHVSGFSNGYLGYYFAGQDGVSFQLVYCDNESKTYKKSDKIFWLDTGESPDVKMYMFYRYRNEKINKSMDDPTLQIKAIRNCENIWSGINNYESGSCMQGAINWIEKIISGKEKNQYYQEKLDLFLKTIN